MEWCNYLRTAAWRAQFHLVFSIVCKTRYLVGHNLGWELATSGKTNLVLASRLPPRRMSPSYKHRSNWTEISCKPHRSKTLPLESRRLDDADLEDLLLIACQALISPVLYYYEFDLCET